jgi:D-alanyl-D-alanine-carboxypeptidase/D-alanyl-D-alanine-endopeptidase
MALVTLNQWAIRQCELRADVDSNMRIAFAWLYSAESGDYGHNGGTGGFSSYCFFNPKGNYAGIFLVNATLGNGASIADLLGQHISQRFAGKPAISLAE